MLAFRFSLYLRSTREWACFARCFASAFDGAVDFVGLGGVSSSTSSSGSEDKTVGMAMALVLARLVRREVAALRGGRDTTSRGLSTVVAVEVEGLRVVLKRDVLVVRVRVDTLGRACTSTAILSGVKLVSLLSCECAIHGTDVHSSIGGKVVKFMHGASGPHREG